MLEAPDSGRNASETIAKEEAREGEGVVGFSPVDIRATTVGLSDASFFFLRH
jgi:hypothetical protein